MTKNLYFWLGVSFSAVLLIVWPAFIRRVGLDVPFPIPGDFFVSQVILLLGHLGSGLVLWRMWKRNHDVTVTDILSSVAACLGVSLLLLIMAARPYSRLVILGTIILSLTFYLTSYFISQVRRSVINSLGLTMVGVVAAVAVFAALHQTAEHTQPEQNSDREESVIRTSLLQLKRIEYGERIPRPETLGGGIDLLDDHVLLATGDGKFYAVDVNEEELELSVTELAIRAPLNKDEFLHDAPSSIMREYFRVNDVLVFRSEGLNKVFVSHHYWYPDRQCYVLRLSETDMNRNQLHPLREDDAWVTVYETSPCIRFDHDSLRIQQLMMSGGRMQVLNDSEILLTVGDHGFDDTVFGPLYAQIPEASYGKILRIDINTGEAETFTTGHRNPQGLVILRDGTIWSTEHGPRGGDELNQIIEGQNYGWPFVTTGTDYHMYEFTPPEWPLPSAHLYAPVYSWVPAVGVSNLIESQSPLFPSWKGDLLVGTLRRRTLFRVRIESGRVILAEPIEIGGRIRDLVEEPSGRILMWLDSGSLFMLSPLEEESSGSALFMNYCGDCHDTDRDGQHSFGPDLGGIYGDPIASFDNYTYSTALSRISGSWHEETLRLFLTNPNAFAPGTTMNFQGVDNLNDLQSIIDYLESIDRE